MKFNFYDIESLSNLFTLANYKPDENCVDIYYLLDDVGLLSKGKIVFAQDVEQRIHEKNKNFTGTVRLLDLHGEPENWELCSTFGLSDATYINNPNAKSSYPAEFRLVCDTDANYDEDKHPYFMGYNSYHYDTTMLTMYMFDTMAPDSSAPKGIRVLPSTAKTMREYNNQLFEPEFNKSMEDRLKYDSKSNAKPIEGWGKPDFKSKKATIRKNMLMSGRHLDVAKLNEKQSKVALKRLLGMLGYQILESDKLSQDQDTIETYDQLLDLIAYNVSDVVNLEKLFQHKAYQSPFMLKKQLMKTYPALIYEKKKNGYEPDISPYTVRRDRLMIDSTSAQFATKSLCPYGYLHDYDTVDFCYPAQEIVDAEAAKGNIITRVNVLEEAKEFFYRNFSQPELRARFDEIYGYYKSIEGKNFNKSKNYLADHDVDPDCDMPFDHLPKELQPYDLAAMPTPNTCMFYYNKDGSPSTCFVNFSTGGIHGAEFNKALYDADMEAYQRKLDEWQANCDLFDKVQTIYPDPCDLKRNKGVTIDGVKYTPSKFLKPKATVDHADYKSKPDKPKEPQVFQMSPKGGWNLNKRYTYTSAITTQHEDFTSYYPNLLRMMRAFWNDGLGYDRYGEIFNDKTKYGNMMKDQKYSKDERDLYSVMRNGTKLILNSASGAGDASFESNVRMNNKIISMRIIGQLFTWRIGQAQTLGGAYIPSTNTDGLYSAGLEAAINNKILEDESREINVEIEPEPIYLISKDSNNRIEVEINDNNQLGEVAAANGASLSCRTGPTPTQSLAHSAVLDWALGEYLIVASTGYKELSLSKPFDETIGMSILKAARSTFNDDIKTLLMFQNVIASSPGSQRYVFATKDGDNTPIPLQHYNRCFIVKDGTPGAYHLSLASAKVITDATRKKRLRMNERAQQHDPIALEILKVNGINEQNIKLEKEAVVSKITGIEDAWYTLIDNRDLYMLDKSEIDRILNLLDYDKYLGLLKDTFEKNWMNVTPEYEAALKQAAENAKKKKAEPLFSNTETNDQNNTETATEADTPNINDVPDLYNILTPDERKVYVISQEEQEKLNQMQQSINDGNIDETTFEAFVDMQQLKKDPLLRFRDDIVRTVCELPLHAIGSHLPETRIRELINKLSDDNKAQLANISVPELYNMLPADERKIYAVDAMADNINDNNEEAWIAIDEIFSQSEHAFWNDIERTVCKLPLHPDGKHLPLERLQELTNKLSVEQKADMIRRHADEIAAMPCRQTEKKPAEIKPQAAPQDITIVHQDGTTETLPGQKIYPLNKTAITQNDIAQAERELLDRGIRETDVKLTLAKLIARLTGTKIDI